MTNEQFIELTEYESQLRSAAYNNFVRFITMDRKQKLSDLYSEIFNKKSKIMNGCGTCALREMKELAQLYFKEKEIRDRKELEPVEDNVTENEKVTTIKASRKSQKKEGIVWGF